LRAGLKLADPSYPHELVPAWATQLMPDSLEIDVSTSGLDLDAVQGLIGPDQGSGCEPSAAEKCSSRRTGYAVIVDAGAPRARVKTQTRQQAPAEISPHCPAVPLSRPSSKLES